MSAKKRSITSNLKKLDNLSDSDIDYSDIPELDESFFTKKTVTLPHKKDSITLRIDHDVLEFYKQQGKGYQTLINTILKMYAYAQLKQKPLKQKPRK